jgi:hypothetical protein
MHRLRGEGLVLRECTCAITYIMRKKRVALSAVISLVASRFRDIDFCITLRCTTNAPIDRIH